MRNNTRENTVNPLIVSEHKKVKKHKGVGLTVGYLFSLWEFSSKFGEKVQNQILPIDEKISKTGKMDLLCS